MKHRTAVTIIAEILYLVSFRMSNSNIIYNGFLSHHEIQLLYLQMLLERRLISKEKGSNVYKTTKGGMQFLELYKELEGFVSNLSPNHGRRMLTSPSGSPKQSLQQSCQSVELQSSSSLALLGYPLRKRHSLRCLRKNL
jgi:predicted transcriptional regulator